MSVLNLVSATNKEGYNFAIEKAWHDQDFDTTSAPAKSSLSEYREKVSFEFFREIYKNDVTRFKSYRKTFKGHYLYSIDGSDLDLPASTNVLDAGYRGATWSKEYETHYPKMFVSHCFDLVNGIVCDFRSSKKFAERALALEMIESLERNSSTIYDRMYCAYNIMERHIRCGSYFLVRARCDDLGPLVVRAFLKQRKSDADGVWKPQQKKLSEALSIRLIRVKHPKTKKTSVFITNAPRGVFTRLDLEKMYLKRWEIETSFKDIVDTLKVDQWHSTKVNGIFQEIYCLLWLVNAVKMQMNAVRDPKEGIFSRIYRRTNFKFCVTLVTRHLCLLLRRQTRMLINLIEHWLRKTLEKRKHHARKYPRAVRRYGTGFSVIAKAPRRPLST